MELITLSGTSITNVFLIVSFYVTLENFVVITFSTTKKNESLCFFKDLFLNS
jgi:hypothetical protein